jgi:phage baseplate assembly protein gpV
VADLERRISALMRHGTVQEVDPAKALVRLSYGTGSDGQPFLSPWVPYAQIAGALKVHTPPSVGQQMTTVSPNGDFQQAVALPMHWSNQNESPSSAGDEHVLTFGGFTITLTSDKLTVSGPQIVLDGDVDLGGEGGQLVHRKGDKDSDNDTAVGSASRVRAI